MSRGKNQWNKVEILKKINIFPYLGTEWAPQKVDDISIGWLCLAFSSTRSIFISLCRSNPYPDLHSAVVVPKSKSSAINFCLMSKLCSMQSNQVRYIFFNIWCDLLILRWITLHSHWKPFENIKWLLANTVLERHKSFFIISYL